MRTFTRLCRLHLCYPVQHGHQIAQPIPIPRIHHARTRSNGHLAKKVFAPPETAPKSEIPPPGALVINTVSIQYGESAHFSCTFVRSACTNLVLIVYSASTFLYFSHTLLQVRRRLPSLCTPPRSMSPQPNFGQALHDSTIIEFVGCCEPSHDSRASGVKHDATSNNQR